MNKKDILEEELCFINLKFLMFTQFNRRMVFIMIQIKDAYLNSIKLNGLKWVRLLEIVYISI
jgi:hypothetical protein